jgi:type IV secretion system protein VirD4
MADSHRSKPHETVALVGLAGLAGAAGVTWLAGATAIRLSGHRLPPHHQLAGLAALAHRGDPAKAWGVPVGPVAVYWIITFLYAAAALVVVWVGWRVLRSARRQPHIRPHDRLAGLADRKHVVTHAGARRLTVAAPLLRPSLPKATASDVGHQVGRSQGAAVWSSVEDSTIVIGPPRAGKGLHLVIPRILDHRGPVITTSTRPDNLAVTMKARATDGRPVAVFDPQRLAPGIPSAARWSPARGCERIQTAMARAAGLVSESARPTENDAFWRNRARDVVRCLLHAAALGHRPTVDLYRWSLSAELAAEAVAVLKTCRADLSAVALESVICGDAKIRDGAWGVVSNTFAALADPEVLAAVSPGPGGGFDPAAFLADRGTLYLLGTATGHTVTAGLVAALIEDVVDTARRAAATSRGARLDPPLALVLDEAGNYPLDSLPSLMSEGGGTGISTMVVLQSLAQARHHWRPDRAQAIWDAATVKVVLGGSGDADDLADLSRLLGDVEVAETSEHVRAGETTVSTSARARPIMTTSQLRTLPAGQAVLLLRTAEPIHLTLSPWTARPDAKELRAAKTEIEDIIRAAAAELAPDVEPPGPERAVLPVWGPAVEPGGDDAVSLDVLKEDR